MSTGVLASCPNLDEDVIFGNFDKNSSGWIWSDDGFLEATATTGWIPRRRARRSESSSSAEKSWCVHKNFHWWRISCWEYVKLLVDFLSSLHIKQLKHNSYVWQNFSNQYRLISTHSSHIALRYWNYITIAFRYFC